MNSANRGDPMIQRLSDWKTEMGAGGRGEALRIRRPLPTEGWRGVLNCLIYFWPTFSSPRAHRHAANPAAPVEFSFFFAFNFGFDFLFFFKPLANLPKPLKIVQKAPKNLPQDPPKTTSKPHLILQRPKS